MERFHGALKASPTVQLMVQGPLELLLVNTSRIESERRVLIILSTIGKPKIIYNKQVPFTHRETRVQARPGPERLCLEALLQNQALQT